MFAALQFAAGAAFAALIPDFRRKPASVPLLPLPVVVAGNIAYAMPALAQVSIASTTQTIRAADWVALAFTAAGTLLMLAARRQLGTAHSWAGTWRPGARLTTGGIYGRLRHPIYVGAGVVLSGSFVTIAAHASAPATATAAIVGGAIVAFLVAAARTEERAWSTSAGPEFAAYRVRVAGLWPRARSGSGVDAEFVELAVQGGAGHTQPLGRTRDVAVALVEAALDVPPLEGRHEPIARVGEVPAQECLDPLPRAGR